MFPEGRIFEFLLLGALALIVIGPKDLPVVMRKVGRFVGHMRGLAAEFRASFDEMARQSELDELRKEVEAMRSGHPLRTAVGLGDETTEQVFADIHANLNAHDVGLSPASFSGPQMTKIEPPAEPVAEPAVPTSVAAKAAT